MAPVVEVEDLRKRYRVRDPSRSASSSFGRCAENRSRIAAYAATILMN